MKKISLRFVFIFLFILSGFSVKATKSDDFGAIKELAVRRVPWLASHLQFSRLATANGTDAFEFISDGKRVRIAATNRNTAAQALGWFLKYYCHRSMSHMGDNLSDPGIIPSTSGWVRVASPYKYRYALNYCTINYSMSFYTWEDWERELDWMALNGVNLMLAPVGMEAVWQKTLLKLGYSDEEARAFIPGPAFSAWWLMGNLEGWGGPVSQQHIDKQARLQKKILTRMEALKINPVMHGFYGMVPTSLKTKSGAHTASQNKWVGNFTRPGFLMPTDPLFEKIAGIYYAEIKRIYGTGFRFFGGDPFHEGGSSAGIDVTSAARKIQGAMQSAFPESTWVLQGWGKNPSPELLAGLNKSQALIIELFGENTRNYEKTNAYGNTPFIWSNVSNFGEKNGIYGRLERFADEVYKASTGPYKSLLMGVGIIPEGIYNNPVAYDLVLELGWHQEKINVKDWIAGYSYYRYGTRNNFIEDAWQQFLSTAYSSPAVYQEGPSESIFCARPALNIKTVSSWGTVTRNYDMDAFKHAVRRFVRPQVLFGKNETYQADRIDFVRQVQANNALLVYGKMCDAIAAKDLPAFKVSSDRFLQMIKQQDSLLANNRFFTLNRWLLDAVQMAGTDIKEQEKAMENAKVQITYWGSMYPATDLHDYAHKEWNGLLGSLYLDRWKAFIRYQQDLLEGKAAQEPDYFAMEKTWAESKKLYFPQKMESEELIRLIHDILK